MSLLTPRDRSLFQELGKYGLLTTSQLSQRIFPGVQGSTVLRRLRALEKGEWIYRIKALESGELVWILSRKGESAVGIITPMIKPNRNGVAHDVLLTELRISLESVGLGQNFIPEWSIRRITYHRERRQTDETIVPDGVFSAVLWNKNVVTVALELEIHGKNLSRYEKTFSKYMRQSRLDLVWYFVRTKSFGEALQAKWKEMQKRKYSVQTHVAFSVIADLKKNPRQASLYFLDGNEDPIEEFFILPEVAQSPAQSVGREDKPENEIQELESAS